MDKIKRIAYELTDESVKVINGSAKKIADELGWNDKTVYGILYGNNPDAFAYFKIWYAACVRAKVDVSVYDSTLSEIRSRYKTLHPGCTDVACLIEHMTQSTETNKELVDALQDGVIDTREAEKIRLQIQRELNTLDVLEIQLNLSEGK